MCSLLFRYGRKEKDKEREGGGERREGYVRGAYIGEGRPKTGMYRAVNRIEEMKRDGERRGKEETVDNEGLSCPSSDVYPFACSPTKTTRVPSLVCRRVARSYSRMHLDAGVIATVTKRN